MSIDQDLRKELVQVAESMQCPPDLYGRVRKSYQQYVNKKRRGIPFKRRILIGVAAAAVLIPSAAFATSYLADEIFGSVKTIERHGGSQESYQEIEGMLQTAKDKLTEEEFQEFMKLLKQMVQLKLKMTDEKGIKHIGKLTKEEQQMFKQVITRLAPYFEKFNGGADKP